MYHILLINSPIEGHLGCLQVWAIMIIKMPQTSTCKFLCAHKFSTPWGKYQGVLLLDRMVRVRLLLRNCQVVPQSACTILHSHQWVPMPHHPHQHFMLSNRSSLCKYPWKDRAEQKSRCYLLVRHPNRWVTREESSANNLQRMDYGENAPLRWPAVEGPC